jgi:RHS repeat-associated protein
MYNFESAIVECGQRPPVSIDTSRPAEDSRQIRKDTITQPVSSPFASITSLYGYGNNSGFITRGFTGHEHLPQFNLINMNGRLYDPTISRMLSPDNYVQDPTHTQSYNRYSYVLNNPLKYTDPSGWILKAAPEKVIGDDLSGGGGGGGSRGNIGYVGDLNSITGMGSFGYNYMGPYSAYASNPGGYAATYGTTANWVTSVHQSSSASMPNWDKGNSSTMYHIAKLTIIDINTFNASTRSNTIIPRTGNNEYNGISWNTAMACENCGVPNTPTRSNIGNTKQAQSNGGDNSSAAFWNNVNTGIGAFDVGQGAKGELISYAAKSSPAINDLKYVKTFSRLGKVSFGASTLISGGLATNYYMNGGTNSSVGIKAGIDIIMGGVGFLGPIGFGISATYFLLDAGGAFGGYGDPLLTPKK